MQLNRIQLSDDNIRKILGRFRVNYLAKKHGAILRKERKFSTIDLILSFWQLICFGEFSYDKWAIQLGVLTKQNISGQAIWKRMNKPILNVLKELLDKSLKQNFDKTIDSSVFKPFTNVYIQDATHFRLPSVLSSVYPGSYSKRGESATAKVQAIFNLSKGMFSDFQLHSFRDNDQKDSIRIIDFLKEGDLVIRDLGYHVVDVFSKFKKKKSFFLSRFKQGTIVFSTEGKRINLLKKIKRHGQLDMDIELSCSYRLPCRLVMIAVPEHVANERRRKAKNDRNKRANHSKEYFKLLGYTLYITNVPRDIWPNIDFIEVAYRSRWYIEILFKGWKSSLKLKLDIARRYLDKQRVEFIYYTSLLIVSLVVMPVFRALQKECSSKKYDISIMKVCTAIHQQITLITHGFSIKKIANFIKTISRYEVRKDRNNAIMNMQLPIP